MAVRVGVVTVAVRFIVVDATGIVVIAVGVTAFVVMA